MVKKSCFIRQKKQIMTRLCLGFNLLAAEWNQTTINNYHFAKIQNQNFAFFSKNNIILRLSNLSSLYVVTSRTFPETHYQFTTAPLHSPKLYICRYHLVIYLFTTLQLRARYSLHTVSSARFPIPDASSTYVARDFISPRCLYTRTYTNVVLLARRFVMKFRSLGGATSRTARQSQIGSFYPCFIWKELSC